VLLLHVNGAVGCCGAVCRAISPALVYEGTRRFFADCTKPDKYRCLQLEKLAKIAEPVRLTSKVSSTTWRSSIANLLPDLASR
jgi:hypothetical protein